MDSIVALDLYSGQLKWHYQTTRHDLWDSGLPNNGVMFTGKFTVDGKKVLRPAVAFVNKVGMTFVHDRMTGKPLLPIPEVKVPVSTAPDVNSSPTQPIPMADNVLFNKLGRDRRLCVDGWLEAVDTKTEASLWKSPSIKYPVASAPVTDTMGGKQYVPVEVAARVTATPAARSV